MKIPNNIMYDFYGCECVGLFFLFLLTAAALKYIAA